MQKRYSIAEFNNIIKCFNTSFPMFPLSLNGNNLKIENHEDSHRSLILYCIS